MTRTVDPSPRPGEISYEQWLRNRIASPGTICGPDVYDPRPWWQHLPGLNPYPELEQQARQAERQFAQASREAEAG